MGRGNIKWESRSREVRERQVIHDGSVQRRTVLVPAITGVKDRGIQFIDVSEVTTKFRSTIQWSIIFMIETKAVQSVSLHAINIIYTFTNAHRGSFRIFLTKPRTNPHRFEKCSKERPRLNKTLL